MAVFVYIYTKTISLKSNHNIVWRDISRNAASVFFNNLINSGSIIIEWYKLSHQKKGEPSCTLFYYVDITLFIMLITCSSMILN